MKKKSLIVLLSILVVIAIIGCFTFLYRAAKKEKDYFYEECIYYAGEDAVNRRLSTSPEKIELGSESKPGYTINFQDYTFTLPGYDDTDIENIYNTDTGSVYIFDSIDDRKTIMFVEWITLLLGSNIFRDAPDFLSQVEKTTGRDIKTFYDLWETSFYCTLDDYTMFDAGKNEVVSFLLDIKYNNITEVCYQFDNGIIKGFICASTSERDSDDCYTKVLFSSCDVPDSSEIPSSYYMITFSSFSIEEVENMLSTLTTDGSSEAN